MSVMLVSGECFHALAGRWRTKVPAPWRDITTPSSRSRARASPTIVRDTSNRVAQVDGAGPIAMLRYVALPLLSPFIVLAVTFRAMDSLRIFDVIYATTTGGPNDATTNLQIMAYQYSFQWYQMGKGMAQAMVLLLIVVMVSYVLMRLWNRASESTQ